MYYAVYADFGRGLEWQGSYHQRVQRYAYQQLAEVEARKTCRRAFVVVEFSPYSPYPH